MGSCERCWNSWSIGRLISVNPMTVRKVLVRSG
jgi:hypothetical protein